MHPNLTWSMNKEILKLAVPSIFANITVPLVGIVDVAIAGHIADASAIGGIAVGTMLFDLLYWNFGFLRVGTGGMTAQAFGRGDRQEITDIFSQSISIALGAALFVFLIGWIFVDIVMYCVPCSAEVESFARQYFNVRIWAAPATLSLMVFKGWFIGMQNTVNPMICDITVNVVNMVSSFYLAVYTPMGAIGVAYGTVIAQYTGIVTAIVLLLHGYRPYLKQFNIKASIGWKKLKHLLSLNGNLFLRSLGFMVVYVGFTALTSEYGDEALAVGAIMMKLFMLFSYFVDGFAYAGEALVGKFIGAKDKMLVNKSVRNLFIWCIGIGLVFTVIYIVSGEGMVRLMTSNETVVKTSHPFLFWLVLMPLISCAAFMWDGVYIGATAGRKVRNCMMYAALGFLVCYAVLHSSIGVQAVYAGYFVHLLVRTLYLSVSWKKVLAGCLPVLLLLLPCANLQAQNEGVTYKPVDSLYMAQIEQMLAEEKVKQAEDVIQNYEEVMKKQEMSFHFEGLNYLVRGALSSSKEKTFRNENLNPLKKYDSDAAEYGLAFSPLAVTWGLKALGVESRSKTNRMLTANALALGLSAAMTKGMKSMIDSKRPDADDSNSMPSGHAAMAFASATILHREYGYISPWISVGGYATATATQYLRLRHNAHWVTDVYVGAGIGTIATNFAYFVADKIFGEDGFNQPKLTMADIERTVKFNTRPTSLSLISGLEWGKEDKVHTSTTFTAGLEYSYFFNKNIAVEALGRLSTSRFYDNDMALSGNIDRYHLDAAFKYSYPVTPDFRISGRAFCGGRYMDIKSLGINHDTDPEAGAGIGFDFMQKDKFTMGVECDYSHTFSDWFTNRWVFNMEWKILL